MACVVGVAAGLGLVPRPLASLRRTCNTGVCVEIRSIKTILLLILVSIELVRELVLGEGMGCVMGRVLCVVFIFWQSPARLQHVSIQACVVAHVTVIILQLSVDRVFQMVIGMFHLVQSPLQSFAQIMTVASRGRLGNLDVRCMEMIWVAINRGLGSLIWQTFLVHAMAILIIEHTLIVEPGVERPLVM